MAIEIQTQTVNTTLTSSQKLAAPKENASKNELEQPISTATTEVIKEIPKEVVKQAAEIPEKTAKSLELPRESIQEAVNKLQDYVDKYNRDLKFSIDDDTGRTVVRLLDSESNVVKQYPSEDVLSLISNLEQNKGLFIDKA